MGAKTGIEWTDATWNPWMGCRKVSPACAHCYMFSDQRRYGHDPNVVRRSKTTFSAPLRWPAEEKRVFTCSWLVWRSIRAAVLERESARRWAAATSPTVPTAIERELAEVAAEPPCQLELLEAVS